MQKDAQKHCFIYPCTTLKQFSSYIRPVKKKTLFLICIRIYFRDLEKKDSCSISLKGKRRFSVFLAIKFQVKKAILQVIVLTVLAPKGMLKTF